MSSTPYHPESYMRTLRNDDVVACTYLYGAASSQLTNRALNWAAAERIRARWQGPFAIKGVLCAEDELGLVVGQPGNSLITDHQASQLAAMANHANA